MRTRDLYPLLVIITLVILLILSHCNRKPIIIPDPYNYITDTIYIGQEYVDKLEKEITELKKKNKVLREAPPKTVKEYLASDPIEVEVEKVPDSIILLIKDLETRLAVSDKYLKNFPEAYKLINFNLNQDELSLGLLNIEGNIFENSYPLYLSLYDYAWFDNKLHYYETSRRTPTPSTSRLSDLILYVDYQFLSQEPKLELEYSLNLRAFRLRFSTNYTLREIQPFEIQAGLGYRLFNN